jgi:hypothetical protein
MKRLGLLAVAFLLAGCTSDAVEPQIDDLQFAKGGNPGPEVVAWVTGHFDRTVVRQNGTTRLQKVSLVAQLLPDGSARGTVRLFFHDIGGDLHADYVVRVGCLDVDGNTAWIGGKVVAPKHSSALGLDASFKIVDDGIGNDVMMNSWRYRADQCTSRPDITPLLSIIHGDVKVVDRR